MNIHDVMKLYGLNASGAKKRLAIILATEPEISADSADSADSTDSADSADSATNDKWQAMCAILDSYNGRFTKDELPWVEDLEKVLGVDLTPETRTKLWSKYQEQKND